VCVCVWAGSRCVNMCICVIIHLCIPINARTHIHIYILFGEHEDNCLHDNLGCVCVCVM